MDKREFLVKSGLAAVGIAAAPFARAASTTVNVGISLAMSGHVAEIGNNVWKGLSLYSDLHADSLPAGVHINTLLRDDKGSPDEIKRIVQELVIRNKVTLLGGVALTPQAMAVAPIVTQAKIPLMVMNASTSSVTRKSPYIVRVSHTNWQTSYTLGVWAGSHGYKRVYTMVADYAAGLDSKEAFAAGFKKAGGEIAGSVQTPITTADYLPYMAKVKESGADALYIFINAGHINAAVSAFADSGLKKAGMKLIGPGDVSLDDELAHMSTSAVGMITAGGYYAGNKIEANQKFVAAWKKKYGQDAWPNEEVVAGWDGMAAYHDLIKETRGKFDTASAMKFLSHWKSPDSPRGPISIDPKTRDIVQNIYINRVELVNGVPFNVNFDKVSDVKDPWKELNPA
jgi:branched-chain amino acid transport system substrate-binding protein